jgi:hypothetical protein
MASDRFAGQSFDGIETYHGDYHQYPVYARDRDASSGGIEGAHKRFVSMPDVATVRSIACFGLQRLCPDAYQDVTDEMIEYYLTSVCSELEMQHSLVLSPTEFYQPFDYIEHMFSSNWGGMLLQYWPATAILEVSLKYSHVQSDTPVQQIILPPQWISMVRNKLNIMADFGTIRMSRHAGDASPLSNILGYLRGPYRPNAVEVRYRAGFESDKMPATVASWIVTLTSIRLLTDIGPILFPYSSVHVGIDATSQTTGLPGPAFLLQRIQQLREIEKRQRMAVKGHFGRNMILSFINA